MVDSPEQSRTVQARKLTRTDAALASSLFVLSLVVYGLTLAPTINTDGDSVELVVNASQAGVAHPPGSPVFIWIGHVVSLLPFGELAARLNWMSALLGAATVAVLYVLLVRHLAASRLAAAAGAAFLALSVTFWSQAVIAELYVPSLALLSLSCLALLEWSATHAQPVLATRNRLSRAWLVVSCATFALSLGVHVSNALYLPAAIAFLLLRSPVRNRERFGTYVKRVTKQIDYRGGIIALLVGAIILIVPYLWLFFALDLVAHPSGPLAPTPGWVRFKEYVLDAWNTWRLYYGLAAMPERIAIFLRLVAYNFSLIGIELAILGAWRLALVKPRVAVPLGLATLSNLVFFLTYRAPDIHVFFIPVFWVIAILTGAGVDAIIGLLMRAMRRREGRSVAVARFAGTLPILLVVAGLLWNLSEAYRENNLSKDLHVRDFYGNLLSELPAGTYYYQRGRLSFPLFYYTELYGVRPDLHVVAGARPGEEPYPPWPAGPTFSGTTSRDLDLPAFLVDNDHDSSKTKWFVPFRFGMFRWNTTILTETGWLKSFSVERTPPDNWLVRPTDETFRASTVPTITLSPGLTLLGVAAEPAGRQGRPWRLIRYWRATSLDLPHVATSLVDAKGNYVAVEFHIPLIGQLGDYLAYRGLTEADLPNLIIREEISLILPSYAPPGKYAIDVSLVRPQLTEQLYDPALAGNLLPGEQKITEIDLRPAPPLNPLLLGH